MDLRTSVFVKGPKSKKAYEKIMASSKKTAQKAKIRALRSQTVTVTAK